MSQVITIGLDIAKSVFHAHGADERGAMVFSRRLTPGYTVYDALIRYDLGAANNRLRGLEVAVNATNLLDKYYLTGCYVNYNWCWYGNRRTVQGTISYKF